jgi:signal transduction histidine kinase
MQVLLSRRKTEIAMLKTTGYRRVDLYALFGLEAGLLGLIGGVVGAAAATGVSSIVRILMQNLGLTVPFQLNPWTIAGGVAIGLVTALIFGLMPIVQAANIRPLNVIRDLSESRGVSSVALTIALLVVLSVLFCALAIVILNNDVVLGIAAVYGTFAFLLVLSVFFGLVVFVVSKLPVPEHFNLKYLALILVGVAASVLLYLVLPVFGILLFAASLVGIVIVLLPRTWKVSTKMALRNIGRQRTRTTTTMLALFIGVFTIGLVLALGQDLQTQISNAFAQNLTYNVVTMTSGTDTFTQIVPTAINGQPLQQVLPTGNNRQQTITLLSSMEGYELSHTTPSSTIAQGRDLNASDAGTTNVVISDLLTSSGPFQMHLKPGDTITIVTIIAAIAGSAFGYLTARGLTRRLKRLSVAADRWGRGDFSALTHDASEDELGQVARQLNRMAEQLQNLLQARQELATLEERNRLARDLHDSVKQQIFAVSMQIGATKVLLKRDVDAAEVRLNEADKLVRQAQQELTSLIRELRPIALEGKGLVAALRELAAEWTQQTDIVANLRVEGTQTLPLTIEEALFRVAQEALANVARHSKATLVQMVLTTTDDTVTLSVSDNGQGFDMSRQGHLGVGLLSMQERMEALGGEVQVESAPGKGTRIVAHCKRLGVGAGDATAAPNDEALSFG